jgi:RimJ/RimL family protein N-acetyltransferase
MLTTSRLLLRQWRDDDLDDWAALNADPSVREFFDGVLTRQDALGSMTISATRWPPAIRRSVLYRLPAPRP